MRILLALAATTAAIALPHAAIAADAPPADMSPALIKALAGRTAGTPQDCIGLATQARSSTIVDGAIIYKESRRRWWVNVPQGGKCSPLKPGRSLVTVTPGSRLCSLELVRIVDLRPVPFDYGQCGLGEFTPYTR